MRSAALTLMTFAMTLSPMLSTSSGFCTRSSDKFADVNQALDAVVQLGKGAEADQLGDLHFHDASHGHLLDDGQPRVGLKLLHADADLLGLGVDAEDLHLDFLALFQHFGGVGDLFRPGDVAHVEQAVDAFFNLDEGAVVRKVAHRARRRSELTG